MRIIEPQAARAAVIACVALCVTLHAARAEAQHGDVAIAVNGNQLVVENGLFSPALKVFLVGSGFPPMPSPPPTQTDNPGFSAPDGTLPAGTKLSLRIVQPLHYWNPATSLVENPTPLDTAFRVETFGGVGIDVTGAGVPDAAPLEVATASAEGGIHQHVLFKLPETTAPNGAYGLVMRLTAPGFVDSAPFLAVFGQQISAVQLTTARDVFNNASAISSTDVLGDVVRNGVVDAADLAAWRSGFGTPAYALLADGDADRDGDVDGGDFLVIQRDMGKHVRMEPAASAVPEPMSSTTASMALLVMMASGRRSLTPNARERRQVGAN